jgi:transposase
VFIHSATFSKIAKARALLDLLRQDRFPQIWRPSPAERDLRQLVWHRQKLVWMRGAVKNQLHALAMGEGVCRKKKLFTAKGRKKLEGLALGPWASYRRQESLRMFDELATAMTKLDLAVEQAARNQPLTPPFPCPTSQPAGSACANNIL